MPKTALLLALASIKRLGDLQALSVSASCLEFNDCKIVLQPCSGYVPKVLTTPFRAQVISLLALPATDGYQWPNLPCPVQAMRVYFEHSKSFRQSEQLFVCFGSCSKGLLVTKAISLDCRGYRPSLYLSGRTVPYRCVGHSTRGISSFWAWSSGISIGEICAAAGWSSLSTFIILYSLDVSALQLRVLSA